MANPQKETAGIQTETITHVPEPFPTSKEDVMSSRDFYKQPPPREVPFLALRPRQAAEALGVSEATLQRLTQDRRVPVIRLDRAVLYPLRELSEWLSNQVETEGGAE